MQSHTKRLFLYGFCAFAIVALSFVQQTFLLPISKVQAQSSATLVKGWMWSDTVGWFDPAPLADSTYDVKKNSDGTLVGYAWTSNIGWIKFGGLMGSTNPPAGVTITEARVDSATSKVLGWARACSVFQTGCSGVLKLQQELGGWDGWISLNCLNTNSCGTASHGVSYSGGSFSGMAWGSDVVGWLSFNCADTGSCGTVDYKAFDADALTVGMSYGASGSGGTATWTSAGASNRVCEVIGKRRLPIAEPNLFKVASSTSASAQNGSSFQGTTGSYTYTISCEQGGVVKSATVNFDVVGIAADGYSLSLSPASQAVTFFGNLVNSKTVTSSLTTTPTSFGVPVNVTLVSVTGLAAADYTISSSGTALSVGGVLGTLSSGSATPIPISVTIKRTATTGAKVFRFKATSAVTADFYANFTVNVTNASPIFREF